MIKNGGRERNGEIESAANRAISIFKMMLTGRNPHDIHMKRTHISVFTFDII